MLKAYTWNNIFLVCPLLMEGTKDLEKEEKEIDFSGASAYE